MDRRLSGPLTGRSAGFQQVIAPLPKLHRHNRLNWRLDPVVLGFQRPRLVPSNTPRKVGAVEALRRRVLDEPPHRGVGKLGTIPCAITSFVEHSRHSLLPLVLSEQLIDE